MLKKIKIINLILMFRQRSVVFRKIVYFISVFICSPAHLLRTRDYADDIALLANTPTQVESLLHSLEPAAGGIRSPLECRQNRVHLLLPKN